MTEFNEKGKIYWLFMHMLSRVFSIGDLAVMLSTKLAEDGYREYKATCQTDDNQLYVTINADVCECNKNPFK